MVIYRNEIITYKIVNCFEMHLNSKLLLMRQHHCTLTQSLTDKFEKSYDYNCLQTKGNGHG